MPWSSLNNLSFAFGSTRRNQFRKKMSLALDSEGFNNENVKTKKVLAKFRLPVKMPMTK